jgi:hypothetical protein
MPKRQTAERGKKHQVSVLGRFDREFFSGPGGTYQVQNDTAVLVVPTVKTFSFRTRETQEGGGKLF